ncbi:MAG: fibrillarin-like rRNA/tRNA 2'-O-methyltransferase [Methanobacteriota archaeon]|nr:MAG: fibrillarin-like rRNA/tRNA 2'-O-methyltransferase [Euryarchaeota archaeon]
MSVQPTKWEGVYSEGPWLLTRNLVPGATVYGEGLVQSGHDEFRRWDANRSKLAAYLKCGGHSWEFREEASVLYLGAGSGTTVSHVSDICRRGTITAVEVASRSFRDLLALAEARKNLVPVLGDATNPESYASHVGFVDILYQDVAQRDQEGIFLKNLALVRAGGFGYLMIKARSQDVAAAPSRVFDAAKRTVVGAGHKPVDLRILSPFQADHAALVVQKP